MADTGHPPRRTLRGYLGVALRGVCMGAADVVPGVSGGTMALITGIYEELIVSIRSFDLQALRLAMRFRWRELLAHVRWPFLVSLLFGLLGAIASLARIIAWLLENKPVLLWAFFFGLVLASVYTIGRRVGHWTLGTALGALIAAVGAYVLVGVAPVETPRAPLYVFMSAVVAICAMILPGISGSFVLVLLGKYHHVLQAINERDVSTLAVFGVGAAVGLAAFSRVLGWVFRHHHDLTVAILTGLMLGSLRKIWPWKETLATIVGRHGKIIPIEQANRLPETFTGDVPWALLLALLGLAAVLVLEQVANANSEVHGQAGVGEEKA